ncbi:MAG: Na+/H+ antiporter NhaC family protein [Clostridia bacterium]|nr:Na+/H+ antiporter NhaC family protein [Clostridia bacterium]
MRIIRNRLIYTLGMAALLVAAMPVIALADAAEETPALYATGWAVLPPVIAIALALITKEVYSSLFLGILSGAILYAGADFSGILDHMLTDGIVASLSDSYNVGILVFLVVLGIMVALMNRSGGSGAFGNWAARRVKSRVSAQLSSIILGVLIFVDDYFNCLTVGSVMKPVTDRFSISRAKLAYIIDATAAPVCIIAPISSWAAAVSGFVEGQNGLTIFLKAIPYNFYALFTIFFMVALVTMKFDFAKMAEFEMNAVERNDLFSDGEAVAEEQGKEAPNGHVADLVFPVIILVISCVIGMIYSGGFFSGESFVDAFANSDASVGLALGSIVALVITVIYYCLRRVISFSNCMECVPEGFKQMVSPILILTFAWSLKAMTDSLGLATYVGNMVESLPSAFTSFIPAILFLVACVLAFASGTSWGTFGILIPIGLAITEARPEIMIPVISACMAGAVYGDHVSPISDTTIMASAGASCKHLNHVATQIPYATTVAVIACISYVIAGFTLNPVVPLIVGLVLVIAALLIFKKSKSAYVVSDEDNRNAAARA